MKSRKLKTGQKIILLISLFILLSSVAFAATKYINTADNSNIVIGNQLNTMFINVTSGNVGIGTIAPSAKLQILTSTGPILVAGDSLTNGTGNFSVALGYNASALGDYSSVLGGRGNLITSAGGYSSITGGVFNTVSDSYAIIAGGEHNKVLGAYGIISGGSYNTVSYYATVSGGNQNVATGQFSVISAGQYNNITNNYATISGGQQNKAADLYATVSGGRQNTASGQYSFAAGYLAKATANGAFALADGSGTGAKTNTANQFKAFFSGGYNLTGGKVYVGSRYLYLNNTLALENNGTHICLGGCS